MPTIYYTIDGETILKKSTAKKIGGEAYQACNIPLPENADTIAHKTTEGFFWHKHAMYSSAPSIADWNEAQEGFKEYWFNKGINKVLKGN